LPTKATTLASKHLGVGERAVAQFIPKQSQAERTWQNSVRFFVVAHILRDIERGQEHLFFIVREPLALATCKKLEKKERC